MPEQSIVEGSTHNLLRKSAQQK